MRLAGLGKLRSGLGSEVWELDLGSGTGARNTSKAAVALNYSKCVFRSQFQCDFRFRDGIGCRMLQICWPNAIAGLGKFLLGWVGGFGSSIWVRDGSGTVARITSKAAIRILLVPFRSFSVCLSLRWSGPEASELS